MTFKLIFHVPIPCSVSEILIVISTILWSDIEHCLYLTLSIWLSNDVDMRQLSILEALSPLLHEYSLSEGNLLQTSSKLCWWISCFMSTFPTSLLLEQFFLSNSALIVQLKLPPIIVSRLGLIQLFMFAINFTLSYSSFGAYILINLYLESSILSSKWMYRPLLSICVLLMWYLYLRLNNMATLRLVLLLPTLWPSHSLDHLYSFRLRWQWVSCGITISYCFALNDVKTAFLLVISFNPLMLQVAIDSLLAICWS